MAVEIVRHLDESQWQEFVNCHPQGQIFHTPEMFQVFARTQGHHPTLWAALGPGGHVLALLLPVNVVLFAGLLRPLTTRAVVYGGVLHLPGREGNEALRELLSNYRSQPEGSPLFTELRNLSDLADSQSVLGQCGFAYEDHLNYLIDLQRPAEEILQSIGDRTRKHIRRGLRRGDVVVEEANKREDVAVIYDLLSETYKRSGVPLVDRSLFDAAFDLLYPKGMIRFTLARVGGAPAAASVDLLCKDVIYGWYGGTARAYSSYQPNELLTWHLLEWGSENGYKVYDFGGAGKPDERYGVRDFKAKFGGELVCFGRNTCVHAPRLLRLSEWGYQIYRRLSTGSALSLATRS